MKKLISTLLLSSLAFTPVSFAKTMENKNMEFIKYNYSKWMEMMTIDIRAKKAGEYECTISDSQKHIIAGGTTYNFNDYQSFETIIISVPPSAYKNMRNIDCNYKGV